MNQNKCNIKHYPSLSICQSCGVSWEPGDIPPDCPNGEQEEGVIEQIPPMPMDDLKGTILVLGFVFGVMLMSVGLALLAGNMQ